MSQRPSPAFIIRLLIFDFIRVLYSFFEAESRNKLSYASFIYANPSFCRIGSALANKAKSSNTPYPFNTKHIASHLRLSCTNFPIKFSILLLSQNFEAKSRYFLSFAQNTY